MLAIVSMLWSADPGLTLRRGVALWVPHCLDWISQFAIQFANSCGYWRSRSAEWWCSAYFFKFSCPGKFPPTDMVYPDAWVGLFVQKNDFGRVIVLTTLVIISAVRKTAAGKITAILTAAAAFGLIFAAESMTAFVTLVGMLVIMQLLPTFRWNSRVRTLVQGLIAAVALPALYLVVQYRGAVTELLGRNSSLTGRVKIWALSVASIAVSQFWDTDSTRFGMYRQSRCELTRLSTGMCRTHTMRTLSWRLSLACLGYFYTGQLFSWRLRRAVDLHARQIPTNSAKWPLVYLCFVTAVQLYRKFDARPNTILLDAVCRRCLFG